MRNDSSLLDALITCDLLMLISMPYFLPFNVKKISGSEGERSPYPICRGDPL